MIRIHTNVYFKGVYTVRIYAKMFQSMPKKYLKHSGESKDFEVETMQEFMHALHIAQKIQRENLILNAQEMKLYLD